MSQIIKNRFFDPNSHEAMLINIPVMSFINDTVQLASSKSELQEILNVAKSFFKLIGIKVNVEKFDLLILNHEKLHSLVSKEVIFNNQLIKFNPKQKSICYLSIFLKPNGNKKYQK